MFATALHLERVSLMNGTIPKFIDAKISLGTIGVIFMQLSFAAAWVISDHNNQVMQQRSMDQLNANVQSLVIELPVTNKTIEVNGNRIATLERYEEDANKRLDALESNQAITHNDVEELKQEIHEIISVSQGRAPLRGTRN